MHSLINTLKPPACLFSQKFQQQISDKSYGISDRLGLYHWTTDDVRCSECLEAALIGCVHLPGPRDTKEKYKDRQRR